jgi:hypothetical protein
MSALLQLLRTERMDGNSIVPRGVADGSAGTTRGVASVRTLYVIGQGQYEQLQRMVFSQASQCPVFAVLDGAIVDDLPPLLQRHAPDAMCLFSGDLDPMLAAAAPYLLPLAPDSGGAQLALRDGWNAHWGIVLVADPGTQAHALRAHLRRILRVVTPGGDSMLFRFYDPRAFRSVVPSFDMEQRKAFFGPIRGCYVEGRDGQGVLHFTRDGEVAPRMLPLAAVA